jgi:hypothetical protein
MNAYWTLGLLLLSQIVFISAQHRVTADLNDLQFGQIIGAPLVAAVNAQLGASKTTYDFLDGLAFQNINGTKRVIMVSFVYQQLINGSLEDMTCTLPFLTMIPIPFLEIRQVKLRLK